jgi:hypothetical protein
MPRVTAGREHPDRHRQVVVGTLMIIAGVALLGLVIAGSYFLTIATARHTAAQTATAVENARMQAEEVSGLRECRALQGLAEVTGGHVETGGYGQNLQAGIARVYAASGCPALLRQHGGS